MYSPPLLCSAFDVGRSFSPLTTRSQGGGARTVRTVGISFVRKLILTCRPGWIVCLSFDRTFGVFHRLFQML